MANVQPLGLDRPFCPVCGAVNDPNTRACTNPDCIRYKPPAK